MYENSRCISSFISQPYTPTPGPPTQVRQSVERQSVLGKAAVVDWMVVVHPNAQDRRRENRTGLPWRKTQDDGHVTSFM